MAGVAWTTLAVLLLLSSFAAHEAAHAIAAKQLGLSIERMQIGVLGPWWAFRIGRLRFSLSPLLLTAAVKLNKEDQHRLLQLPYRDQAWLAGAGVIGNLVFCCVLFALSRGMRLATGAVNITNIAFVVAGLALGGLAWRFRRAICAHVVLSVGIVVLGITVLLAFADPFATMIGPSAIVDHLHVRSCEQALQFGAFVSLNMFVFNLLPLLPFDGGALAVLYARRKWGNTIGRFATWATAGLTLCAVALIAAIEAHRWV